MFLSLLLCCRHISALVLCHPQSQDAVAGRLPATEEDTTVLIYCTRFHNLHIPPVTLWISSYKTFTYVVLFCWKIPTNLFLAETRKTFLHQSMRNRKPEHTTSDTMLREYASRSELPSPKDQLQLVTEFTEYAQHCCFFPINDSANSTIWNAERSFLLKYFTIHSYIHSTA
jgi:hypothetical protein